MDATAEDCIYDPGLCEGGDGDWGGGGVGWGWGGGGGSPGQLPPGSVVQIPGPQQGPGASSLSAASDSQSPWTGSLYFAGLLGSPRINLLQLAQNATLRNIIAKNLYKVGARIGDGSTMDALRYEPKESAISTALVCFIMLLCPACLYWLNVYIRELIPAMVISAIKLNIVPGEYINSPYTSL